MNRWLASIATALIVLAASSASRAHESRPGYLQVNEVTPGRYAVVWRTPLTSGMRLPVKLVFPEGTTNVAPPSLRELPDSRIEHFLIENAEGLLGKRIAFAGLQATITDVLVRVQLADGTQSDTLVHPSQAWVDIAAAPSQWSVARTYVRYGIEHILGGIDHLLFVLALLLIVRDARRMIFTITAFTVAHSLTLGAATLGWVRVPGAPIEAVIALSIVFVAAEILRSRQGADGLIARAPWVVAFGFGLLHGFGFAGALADVGLPKHAIPTALLCFNVGVELGQLMFVGIVLSAIWVLRKIPAKLPRWTSSAVPYLIGSIAMFWTVERVFAFWPSL